MKTRSPIIAILIALLTSITVWAQQSATDSVDVVLTRCSFGLDDTSKVVPIYKFKDDVVGEFMNRFCDSLVVGYRVGKHFKMINYAEALPRVKRNKLDSIQRNFTIVKTTSLDHTKITACKAIIETNGGTYGFMDSTSDHWLETMHLVKTNRKAMIKTEEDKSEFKIAMLDGEYYTRALINIFPNGWVDVLLIEYDAPQGEHWDRVKRSFVWIDLFYEEHGYPAVRNYKFSPTEYIIR